MRDYLEIQTTILNALLEDELVNNVATSVAEVNQKHTLYWTAIIECNGRTDYEDYSVYDYNMYFVNKQMNNQTEVAENTTDWNYSMGMLIAKNALKRLEEQGIMTQYPMTFSFASVRFADVCDCVTLKVMLQVENEIDCD